MESALDCRHRGARGRDQGNHPAGNINLNEDTAESMGYTAPALRRKAQPGALDRHARGGRRQPRGPRRPSRRHRPPRRSRVRRLRGHPAGPPAAWCERINPVRHGNQTPLDLAVEVGNEVAVKMLLSAGADPSLGLLSACVEPSSVGTIHAFLRCGADVNALRASDGNIPASSGGGGVRPGHHRHAPEGARTRDGRQRPRPKPGRRG